MVTAETKIFSVAVQQGKSKEPQQQMVYKVANTACFATSLSLARYVKGTNVLFKEFEL